MKIDFYIQIHKAIRRWLFNFSNQVAVMDFDDENCRRMSLELGKITALLRSHAHHEEECFHPLITKILAGKGNKFEQEHQEQEVWLIGLEQNCQKLMNANINQRQEYGLEFYKELNRFISNYLQHMAEEEAIMPLLQESCSAEELLNALQSMFNHLSKQEMINSIGYMLPALNPTEQMNMIRGLKHVCF